MEREAEDDDISLEEEIRQTMIKDEKRNKLIERFKKNPIHFKAQLEARKHKSRPNTYLVYGKWIEIILPEKQSDIQQAMEILKD